ncbi:MAG: ATP-binding protein [Clostridia bacterium]|nr:ATP-binding protein [Clostridia bacterium]
MKYELLPPYAPMLMESTRAVGYSVETAVADIIDNSIAASATRVDIDFEPGLKPYIVILDNGCGMDEETLKNAMRYGSANSLDVRSSNDLGRYGLGLKTASMSQCRILTVISKVNNETHGCQWNLDVIKDTNNWTLILLDEESFSEYPDYDKLSNREQGTLVIWQDLDKFAVGEPNLDMAFNKKIPSVRKHLSLVFHRYLAGEPGLKKISIWMNERPIAPQDPFMKGKSTQVMDTEYFTIRGEKIAVTPYTLPHPSKLSGGEMEELSEADSLRKLQGFYVYRNKRLLVWGTWFRLLRQGDLTKLARVQVDIPNSLDDLWSLDVKKSSATPPEEVRIALKTIIDRIAESSKRTYTFRGKKEVTDKVVHVWDRKPTRDGVLYEINMAHPMIQSFISLYPGSERFLKNIFNQISASIPLNKIYVDINDDNNIINDSENKSDSENVIEIFKTLLALEPEEERVAKAEALLLMEPFCKYQDEISKALEEDREND